MDEKLSSALLTAVGKALAVNSCEQMEKGVES